ncbi:MAG: nicotinate-nucleotide--dimethylbenzimidazole phosphoribosyltransferase [Clostridiaceae bacterium]
MNYLNASERALNLIPGLEFKAEGYKEENIKSTADSIVTPDFEFYKAAMVYVDSLCKPPGSLGKMEDFYGRLFSIFNGSIPEFKKCVVVFAGDNGVTDEGISRNPVDTTQKICMNILNGGSGLCKIGAYYNTDIFLEDIGVIRDIEGHTDHKVLYGTQNSVNGPAMSREEAAKCILSGMQVTEKLIESGYNLIGAGEMGVGNTTTSAAVLSALTGAKPGVVTGYGSGISHEDLLNKIRVVGESINNNQPFTDLLDLLRKISGADILAMTGAYLKCAEKGIPFVLDGVISIAALISATYFNKDVLSYAFPSHSSVEPGFKVASEFLGLKPPIDMDMRLGEGSGCPIGMNIMELSIFTLSNMAKFEDVSVDKNDYIDIRRKEN